MNINNLRFRILNRLGYYKKGFKLTNKKLHNNNWKIPTIEGVGYPLLLGNTENWLFDLLQIIHREIPIQNFIDVGINIGQTLIKVKSVDKNIPYTGFEPNINCVNYVSHLRTANQRHPLLLGILLFH